MKTLLSLLTESLSQSADETYDIVGKIGVSESLNHFELNLRNWISAFFFFIAMQSYYLDQCDGGADRDSTSMKLPDGEVDYILYIKRVLLANLDEINELIIDSVQGVFDVIEQDIGRGTIIPRTANHLGLSTLKWKITFLDYKDIISALALATIYPNEQTELKKMSTSKIAGLSDDESEWLMNWMDNNLAGSDNDSQNAGHGCE